MRLFAIILITICMSFSSTVGAKQKCMVLDKGISFCPKKGWYFIPFQDLDDLSKKVVLANWHKDDYVGLAISPKHAIDDHLLVADILSLKGLEAVTPEELKDMMLTNDVNEGPEFSIFAKEAEILQREDSLLIRLSYFRQKQDPKSPEIKYQPTQVITFLSSQKSLSPSLFLQTKFANTTPERFQSKWKKGKTLDDFRLDFKKSEEIHLEVMGMLKK